MVWIRSKGRVDLCSEIGIEIGTEMGTQREQQIQKKWVERERERVYKGVVERNNKKIMKIDYLNKRDDRIDKLMWVFCKNGCIKQKKQVFSVKMDM